MSGLQIVYMVRYRSSDSQDGMGFEYPYLIKYKSIWAHSAQNNRQSLGWRDLASFRHQAFMNFG